MPELPIAPMLDAVSTEDPRMRRSFVLGLPLIVLLPAASLAAGELPGSNALVPPLVATPDNASSVPVPGAIDLAPAAGFS